MNTEQPVLPPQLHGHPDSARLHAALISVGGCGAALRRVRGGTGAGREVGDQLKTAIDRAAEGWVLGYLEAVFPEDAILAEERYDAAGGAWQGRDAYWTIDALDGTRSYIDGFDGFCVQVALVRGGAPVVAAIDEPALGLTWAALAGAGAYVLSGGAWARVAARSLAEYPSEPRFVDSTPPGGAVGQVMARRGGRFVEHGSIGAKALRVADGSADVFAKDLRFRLWDVAPADLILRETGGRLGTWDGAAIPYASDGVLVKRILAAPQGLFERVVDDLRGGAD
jgi:3'(2'), 5'-bisphosphate nucleotidase